MGGYVNSGNYSSLSDFHLAGLYDNILIRRFNSFSVSYDSICSSINKSVNFAVTINEDVKCEVDDKEFNNLFKLYFKL